MIYAAIVGGLIVGVVGLLVIIASLRPGDFTIVRSQVVAASPEQIFPYIDNLRKFQEWNPFRDKDPNASNEFSGPEAGVGATFRWSGNANAGVGIMTIVSSTPDQKVDIDLEFIKPFPGHNAVEFSLQPQAKETMVTWRMSGKHALIPKIVGMFLSMDQMIGGEFEKGLKQLKQLAESPR